MPVRFGEVMISEFRESSMVVRITLGASAPEIAFQLKSSKRNMPVKHRRMRDIFYWNYGKGRKLPR
jgi:hypothetical protein